MVRKFFVAFLLGLLVISSSIASAEDYWTYKPRISSKPELAKFIDDVRQYAKTREVVVAAILTGGFSITENDLVKLSYSAYVTREVISDDGKNMRVIFRIREYPGARVANAYRSGDISGLSAEERQLYNVAVGIINEANKKENDLDKEFYIYEEIMNRAEYFTSDMNGQPRFVTAIGALIDGKANCQGYTDAFYMLMRMLGIDVGKMVGEAGGEGHIWNTMTFADGNTFCVDVTWGDHGFGDLNSYIYFNAPVEIMQETHKWDWSSAQAIQGGMDERYSYGSREENLRVTRGTSVERFVLRTSISNRERRNNAESGLNLLAQKIAQGGDTWWFTVMTPYDERYADFNKAAARLKDELGRSNFSGTVGFALKPLGKKYLFFCAHRTDSTNKQTCHLDISVDS